MGARGETILIVDDEPDNRAIFGTMLRHVGLSVLEAANGTEGVHLATEHRPDLILLDMAMPRMDGWDVIAALRAVEATASIQVIALTAQTLDAEKLNQAGFCGYLQKPLEPRVLAAEIERCLGLREGERLSALRTGGTRMRRRRPLRRESSLYP